MPSNEKEKVAPYLLTPEVQKWSKEFKNQMRGLRYLKQGLMARVAGVRDLQQMLGMQQERIKAMLQQQPKEKINELGDQVVGDEEINRVNPEQLEIGY